MALLHHCNFCNEDVLSNCLISHSESDRHILLCAQEKSADGAVYIVDSAFKCRIITYRINGSADILDPKMYLLNIGETLEKLITIELKTHKHVKINVELFGTFVKTNAEGEVIRDLKSFNTKNVALHKDCMDFPSYFEQISLCISKKCEDFNERDSGWGLEKIEFLNVNVNKYQPLKGSTYIPLPPEVQSKNACVNVKNRDNKCFYWAIISALYPVDKNSDRPSSYPHYTDIFNVTGIKDPVCLSDIKKFEKLNKISVNVYGIDTDKKRDDRGLTIVPLRISKMSCENHVNLLYFERGDVSHYCWIKNLSRLVSSQISKHGKTTWICDGCLHPFANKNKLDRHRAIGCGETLVELPKPNNKYLRFKNYKNKMKVPFVIYGDFESILVPLANEKSNTTSATCNTHKHVPCSFSYYIHCEYDNNLSKFVIYRGEDCVEKFIQSIREDADRIIKILQKVVPPKKNYSDSSGANTSSNICHICKKKIGDDEAYVIDHCHLTGNIRGKTHNSCNLNYQLPKFIPVVFHNLSGYDCHLFIKELAKIKGKLTCIPINKEKYISFDLRIDEYSLRFVDSYKFMSSSLDKLVSNLSQDQFKILPNFLPPSDNCYEREKYMKLLTRKGVFPYEYVSDWRRLEETALPPQAAFYSSLTDLNISDEDYQHAKDVWDAFNITTLGEYCDLYLKTDVLLLAEVFENFRQVCIGAYELDPCQYVTAPGLSWDAMLKHTEVCLELFTDYEMIQFIKKGIRGGVCQASNRYAKANNIFMHDYDVNQDSSFIIYLDINNLYGDAMRRPLPIDNFRWMSEDEVKLFDISTQRIDSDVGYILEVDLEYPHSLHDLHNDYPFCAETKLPIEGKIKKLLLTFDNKTNYVVHYANLKLYIKKGLICKKIHRILTFNQSSWLKSYIDLNSQMRVQAKNSFEKDFFKLMNNSIFGKTIENVEKRVDVKLCKQWDTLHSEHKQRTKPTYGLDRYISRPNFHSASIFSEELVAVQMNKTIIVYDKPIYVGFSVLDLSKQIMYNFHYDYMLNKYGDNVSLLYTDTDSFVYHIKTDNFYEDIKPDLQSRFDTSDLPQNNVYNLPQVNKKVVGMMKDENNGRIIREFVGLRAKMYAYILDSDDNNEIKCIKKNKGVNAAAVRRLNFNKYYTCLDLSKTLYDNMYNLISDKHNMYTQIRRKKILCGKDEKRFILNNGNKTLAWGHCKIDRKSVV